MITCTSRMTLQATLVICLAVGPRLGALASCPWDSWGECNDWWDGKDCFPDEGPNGDVYKCQDDCWILVDDCGANEECVDPIIGVTKCESTCECTSSSQCDWDEKCVSCECVDKTCSDFSGTSGSCSWGGTTECKPGETKGADSYECQDLGPVKCWKKIQDCSNSKYCYDIPGFADPECVECYSDSHCGSNEECDNYQCESICECDTNSDCTSYEKCDGCWCEDKDCDDFSGAGDQCGWTGETECQPGETKGADAYKCHDYGPVDCWKKIQSCGSSEYCYDMPGWADPDCVECYQDSHCGANEECNDYGCQSTCDCGNDWECADDEKCDGCYCVDKTCDDYANTEGSCSWASALVGLTECKPGETVGADSYQCQDLGPAACWVLLQECSSPDYCYDIVGPADPECVECYEDDHCSADEECDSNKCVPACECSDDSDCAGGQKCSGSCWCVDKTCEEYDPPLAPCSPEGSFSCQPNQLKGATSTECQSMGGALCWVELQNCSDSQYCFESPGGQAPTCVQCYIDEHCPEGPCEGHQCVCQCNIDQDCPEGQKCDECSCEDMQCGDYQDTDGQCPWDLYIAGWSYCADDGNPYKCLQKDGGLLCYTRLEECSPPEVCDENGLKDALCAAFLDGTVATGTIGYEDYHQAADGELSPNDSPNQVRFGHVDLLTSDGTVIASGSTVQNGTFSIPVVAQEGVEVYARVTASTQAGLVASDLGTLSNELYVYPPTDVTGPLVALNPPVADFGQIVVPLSYSDAGAFNILDMLLEGFVYLEDEFPSALDSVEVWWSEEATVTCYCSINFKKKENDDGTTEGICPDLAEMEWENIHFEKDSGDLSPYGDLHPILHEYGHFIHDQLESQFVFGGGDHAPCSKICHEHGTEGAWSEGLASFFALDMFGQCDLSEEGVCQISGPFENGAKVLGVLVDPSFSVSFEAPVDSLAFSSCWVPELGCNDEASVGGVLWDLVDTANEPHDNVAGQRSLVLETVGQVHSGGWGVFSETDLCEFMTLWLDKTQLDEQSITIASEFVADDCCAASALTGVCGDGVLDCGEGCEQETQWSCPGGMYCDNCTCVWSTCNDGVLEPTEYCEINVPCPPGQYCMEDICWCAPNDYACANGTLENFEECDLPHTDACESYQDCIDCECVGEPPVFCGNGIIDGDENCEEQSDCENDETCDNSCHCVPIPAACEDGKLDPGEECDLPFDAACESWENCVGCICKGTKPTDCGNGVLEYGEDCEIDSDCGVYQECDQQNCDCVPVPPECGDGKVDPGEQCDKPQTSACEWYEQCVGCQCEGELPVGCDNGVVDEGEECEENSDCEPNETCDNTCHCVAIQPACTDGKLDPGEECDLPFDAACEDWEQCVDCICDGTKPADCGNFELEFGEECEEDGDCGELQKCEDCKCLALPPECGDEILHPAEQCDIPHTDACEPEEECINCKCESVVPVCGNGVVEEGEECDDGTLNSDIQPDKCRTSCVLPYCGDGVKDTPEDCDDGNLVNDDGCSAECTDEDPKEGSIIITEIMKNPTGSDTGKEWIELHNTELFTIDVGGWLLETNDLSYSYTVATNQPTEIPPGGYFVIGASTDEAVNGGIQVDHAWFNFNLLNNGSIDVHLYIALESGGTELSDELTYDDDNFPDIEGASLSLHPQYLGHQQNDLGASWCPSTSAMPNGDLGTPGGPNDPCFGYCGDGVVGDDEQCDDGDANSDELPDACRTDCTLPSCGDWVVDSGEECDDGNNTPGDECDEQCQVEQPADPVCGNGIKETGEECDDGNTNPGDGCDQDCNEEQPQAVCGNDILEPGEECDDGNLLPADGCSPDCELENLFCGDGIQSPGEECDDGNNVGGDGCSALCEEEEIQPGDIIVSEIMKNPTGPDTPGEWFEVHNTTSFTIDLNEWQLVDTHGDGLPHDIDSGTPLEVEPGGYLVFALNGDAETNGGVDVDYVYPQEINLANSAPDGLALIEDPAEGIIIDEVEFDPDTFPNEQGRSLTLHPGALDHLKNDDPANWCSATDADLLAGGDFGTPGAVNSSCTGSVCGDGVVDEGEQCDPGPPQNDACCNAGTCQLQAPCCGNLTCEEPGENCLDCEIDCGACPCAPDCAGKGCNEEDGCGNPCGCPEEAECCDDGSCEADCDCEPDCDAKDCGDDGCGGTCGECDDGLLCADGKCQFDCSDLECQPGDKGCTEDGTAVWVCEDDGAGCGVVVEKNCAAGWTCVDGLCVGIEEVVTPEPDADVVSPADVHMADGPGPEAVDGAAPADSAPGKDVVSVDMQLMEGSFETMGGDQTADASAAIEEEKKAGGGGSGCGMHPGTRAPVGAGLLLLLTTTMMALAGSWRRCRRENGGYTDVERLTE